MILQALKGYYEREKANLPPFGYQDGKIHFELVLDCDGKLVAVNDIRPMIETGKKKKVMKRASSKSMPVPSLLRSRTSIGDPNFAWDNTGYVLGVDAKGKKENALKCFESFKAMHHELGDEMELPLMQALLKFLDDWKPEQTEEVINAHTSGGLDWEEIASSNLVIRLEGELTWLHDYSEMQKVWQEHINLYYHEHFDKSTGFESLPGFCLVNGRDERVVRLHLPIKGVRNAQSTGASVISFKKEATKSYGKDYNFNAPVGVDAAFEYATALNSLLSNYDRKVQIGDATTVFWTEKPSEAEGLFASAFKGTEGEDAKVHKFLTTSSRGNKPDDLDLDVPFYILGLSPNSARISVRFWYASTVGEISERLGQHFDDLRIERQFDNEPKFPDMWRLLTRTAMLEKTDNISPVLSGEFMRAILTGGDYPASLLSAVVSRIRSEHRSDYLRAALIKACLVRRHRINKKPLEVTMSLNKESESTAYLIGRLFAICEGAQEAALGKINRTIKD
ncbi:type I-C CRISPR-associated protein Cas8c/Csd1, partial [bacterium]|nr:type I-C CRISPR-associated protein Cas8c/Csd1 [bacterium]